MTEEKNDLQELIESMKLDETVFTPEVIEKVKLVVESKVNERLEDEKEKLEETNKQELKEFKDDLVDRLDEYMNYFVEEFTKENKKDIVDSVKVKTAERILENFNKMVNDFNVSLSEETIDQSDKIEELEADLNETINKNIDLQKQIAESNKYAMILDRVMKLDTDIEKSKFAKLAESYDYEDEDSFSQKLDVLQESICESSKDSDSGDEETLIESEKLDNNKRLDESLIDTTNKRRDYVKVLYRTS